MRMFERIGNDDFVEMLAPYADGSYTLNDAAEEFVSDHPDISFPTVKNRPGKPRVSQYENDCKQVVSRINRMYSAIREGIEAGRWGYGIPESIRRADKLLNNLLKFAPNVKATKEKTFNVRLATEAHRYAEGILRIAEKNTPSPIPVVPVPDSTVPAETATSSD